MILKKPYAFFIKMFKPAHIFLSFLVMLLIHRTNEVLSFYNQYIYTTENVVGKTIRDTLISNSLFIIPIILIIFSIIFLGIMYNKKKPIVFYIINIFALLVVIIISLYSANFLEVMEKNIVSIKLVKFNHDLILINMIIEVVVFVFLIIRGLGINLKKFNFDSDITKLNINDSDREEFELSINLDLDIAKRNRNRNLRYFKYLYIENRIIINIFVFMLLIICILVPIYVITTKERVNSEGITYNIGDFNMIVNESMLLREDFAGNVLTENYLVVIDFSLQTYFSSISLFKKDFSLQIGDAIFHVETKYKNALIDIGNLYNNNILSEEYENYLLVFEIPEKYINSEMFLVFNNEGTKTQIKLEPKNLANNTGINVKNLTEQLSFEESIGKISFTIQNFEIKNEFLIKYNYCVSDNDCVISKEHIKSSINENFDKIVLKLEVDYIDESKLNIKNFYYFLSNFGAIHYKIGDSWFSQSSNFEELKSKKTDNKNNVYIGVNSNIMNSESIKFVFNIRNSRYEYILK